MSSEEREETIGDAIQRLGLDKHPDIIKINEELGALHKLRFDKSISTDSLEFRIHLQKISDKHFERRRTYERLAGWPPTSM